MCVCVCVNRSSCLLVSLECSVWVWSVTCLWSKQTAVLSELVSLSLQGCCHLCPPFLFLFSISFSFLLFLYLSAMSYLTRSDKKLDLFSLASESWLLRWRLKKTDTVLVLLWVFVTLMHTTNLSCDTDHEEIEPGKIWWYHSSPSINSSSMKSLQFIMLSVLSFTYCCFDWFVTEVCTFPL